MKVSGSGTGGHIGAGLLRSGSDRGTLTVLLAVNHHTVCIGAACRTLLFTLSAAPFSCSIKVSVP